jgi:hypothetical protein
MHLIDTNAWKWLAAGTCGRRAGKPAHPWLRTTTESRNGEEYPFWITE